MQRRERRERESRKGGRGEGLGVGSGADSKVAPLACTALLILTETRVCLLDFCRDKASD